MYSPLPLRALAAGVRAVLRGSDPRPTLRSVLMNDYDAAGVLLTDSGTSALQVAIRLALGGSASDRAIVALPAFTCYDVATAAIGAGADVILYDIDPEALAPDPDSLRSALERGARAIVAAPLMGVPFDWNALADLAARYGVPVVEDAAQGHGASWEGRPLGTLGALSVLSFGRGKGWTGGGGGALLWRRNRAVPDVSTGRASAAGERLILVKAAAQAALGRPALYRLPRSIPWLSLGETRFHAPRPVREAGAASAAILLATRMAAREEAAVRRRTAAELLELLPANVLTVIRAPEGGVAGYLRLPVRLRRGGAPAVAAALSHLGVAPGYPLPLSRLPALAGRVIGGTQHCPGAETLVRDLITVPCHSRVTRGELHALAAGLQRA
ncbi:MAG TPA: DegT/DnrJ/EryC1/StrS family aminotransferase [Longimicrobiales bacterium]